MSESSETDREATRRELETLLSEFDDPEEVFELGGEMSVDTLFDALAHPGRRYVLTYLLLREEFVSLSELADFVVGLADGPTTGSEFRDELVMELTTVHLPQLDDAGLVEYRVERQFVGPTDRTIVALPYLDLALRQVRVPETTE